MGALGQQKTEQRQPHADENDLPVRNFPCGSRYHQLSRGVNERRFSPIFHFGSNFFSGSQVYDARFLVLGFKRKLLLPSFP
jgi:hypothetical protein